MRLINQTVSRRTRFALGAVPFVVLIVVYAVASDMRRAENPADKLLPSLGAMSDAFARMAFSPDRRSGNYLLWADTADSLFRLGLGVSISAFLALCLGIVIGFIPNVRAGLAPIVAAISLVPPLAVLPILFITFGLGELAKVALIIVGIMPVMTRSMAQSVSEIPSEQIIKAQTLGASTWQMIVRIVLPQVLPKLITATRLALGPAWIFLISAEAIAATGGLGYRIFLVRRYLAMDIILPYVVWITLLAFALDQCLRAASRRAFGWAHLSGGEL